MAATIVGNVGTIVSVALKIKEAVKTVQQNKEECDNIAKFVAQNCALLKRLEERTEITKDKATRDALEDLAGSLKEALKIVTECQGTHIIDHLIEAGDMAKELRRVKKDILQKIQQASFATIIMTTHIQHASAPPPSPPPEQVVTHKGFVKFSLSELKAATNDFSNENIIGVGGSAVIYKGKLHNGLEVAIKNFCVISNFDVRMFRHEFEIGVKLQHKNVINVLGYCIDVNLNLVQKQGKCFEVQERRNFLVLEYMPNGSLHNTITQETRCIDWSTCFRIIEGIAKCVDYLHEKRVVHMDLKPEKILLDLGMNPVITDFGISKVLDHDDDKIFVEGREIESTPGYVAPEHIEQGMVSTKCDVYAFGITLCQTISSVCTTSKTTFIGSERWEWDWMVQEAGGVRALLDRELEVDESQVMEIQRCMQVALMCTEMDPKDRPTMATVVQMLNVH